MVNENLVKDVVKEPYKYGFVTDIETEKISKGLNEDIIRLISQKIGKNIEDLEMDDLVLLVEQS